MSNKIKGYCDVCTSGPTYLYDVILKDESGIGNYCETCILNNPHVKLVDSSDPKHILSIQSLHDAMADCSCGWHYAATGERTITEIEIMWNKHWNRPK